VWGFSDSTPLSKKNYAIAVLIIMVVGAVMGFLFGASVFSVFSNMS
jgi:hypothetical protein